MDSVYADFPCFSLIGSRSDLNGIRSDTKQKKRGPHGQIQLFDKIVNKFSQSFYINLLNYIKNKVFVQ